MSESEVHKLMRRRAINSGLDAIKAARAGWIHTQEHLTNQIDRANIKIAEQEALLVELDLPEEAGEV